MNESTSRTAPIVELDSDYKIALPAEVAEKFRPADRFFVWPQGDMLILKRVVPAHVTEIVAGAPDDELQPTMEEIDEIVHQVRSRRSSE